MDVLTGDVAQLDGPLLAALWARAVLAADAATVIRCEAECVTRGVTPRALLAATKKKQEPAKTGDMSAHYAELSANAQQRKAEGKKFSNSKQAKGYNPYRKKKGEKGGGQFASKGDSGAERTDPDKPRDGAPMIQEDEVPATSPKGAKLEDFRGPPPGMAVYEDGSIYDGKGWRNSKGEALDDSGNKKKKTSGAGAKGRSKEERDAEAAKKKAERDASDAWDSTENRRKAEEAASKGNYAPLVSIAERSERAARKRRDLATSEADRAKAERDVAAAEKDLADVRTAADKAKADKDVSDKAAREKKTVDAKTEREAASNAARTAEYTEIAKNYPVWEAELRAKYTDTGLSDAEMRDLIIRDRARRVRALPRRRPPVTAAVRFDPMLHPKGKDGKFIETFGLVDVFGLHGFQHGQRGHQNVQGQVTEIVPNAKNPGDPIIRVKVTDPRWDPKAFGETVDVHANQVANRAKPKAVLPKHAPHPDIAKTPTPSEAPQIPARTPTPGMPADPDGPNFKPLTTPPEWASMGEAARTKWVKDRMEADLSGWRGEPTGFDFTGFNSGIALNMANTYRDLANWDPATARRIDNPIVASAGGAHGLSPQAIAVAHPGTKHPGGIGEKIKPSAIVFGAKYAQDMEFWKKQQQQSANLPMPWSTSSVTADPTVTLIHEFGHQQQFRYLDIAMRDAGKAWSPTVRDDGFGLIPDTSNWQETQNLRYTIPELTSTQYGHSKSSEGFAEGVAERAIGISSPELNDAYDQWFGLMGMMEQFPSDRYWDGTGSFDDLSLPERDQFWQANGQYLDLPGMRAHYPDSAKAYDAWKAGKPAPAPTPGQKPGWMLPGVDWDEDVAAQLNSPHDLEGLTLIDPGGRHGKILNVNDDGTKVTVQYKPGFATTITPTAGYKVVMPDTVGYTPDAGERMDGFNEGAAQMMPQPGQDPSRWIPGVGDVDEYLAAHPREPGEALFVWQGRIVDGLPPRPKHALMFEIRERYEGVPFIAEGMTRWRAEHGLPEPKVDISEIPADQLKAYAVAREFEDLPDEADNPAVQVVYEDFIKQSEEMFDFMTKPESEGGLGITVEFWTNPDPTQFGVGPYQDATEQAEDLRVNHRIKLEAGLGGHHEATMDQGQYDRFRAVHDVFGHAGIGGGFDRHGEYQAYLAHASMYSGNGHRGMASEYHGVNSAAWSGIPGSPGTGKSLLLPEILISPPWDADGNPIRPPTVDELRPYLPPRLQAEIDQILPVIGATSIPEPSQLGLLHISADLAAALGYLADQTQLDHVFANAYEDAPYHQEAA